jgi:hypothetical protein
MNVGSGDIVDRLSIVILKKERAEGNIQEYEAYKDALSDLKHKYPNLNWELFLDLSYKANGIVWDLESALRNAQLDNDPTEAGRRAILIRKVNGVRIGIKNLINSLTGEGFLEVKHIDHLSR